MRLPSIVALFVSALSVSVPIIPAAAHPGGLNSEGCHNNRKTNGYHCHRGSNASPDRSKAKATSLGGAYRNCTAARAAGAAPVYRGEPGYGPHLDRDNDGVGCE